MTVLTSFYAMDNKAGVNLNSVIATNASDLSAATDAKLGDQVDGNGGSRWVLVQASATVTAYNLIAIDSAFQARNATSALATSNAYSYGVAEFPPNQLGATVSIGNANGGVANPGEKFWAAMFIQAGGQINAAVTAAVGAKLFISTLLAGSVSSSVTVIQMTGIALVGTILATISVPQTMEFVQFGDIVPYASV